MTTIQRSALVGHTPAQMFDLVNDVEAYPRRFDWCSGASILVPGKDEMMVRLDLRLGALRASFTTRNTLVHPERIDIRLVEGPFRHLRGEWRFDPLGEAGTRVGLTLDFEFAGRLVGSALARGFQGTANRMVDDFCRAARRVYAG
ncbi:MAG TPA: type II toxin-antitoxin system RatA family toxin [Xanthomonadaceae bacterium]|nr:type II toxin-antitoxin system RatA family toxin [Xanthomonadaceae bacterium]